jgi:D-ornithine 4,5-aminomutase subunit beta
MLLIAGGGQVTEKLAGDCGMDMGFGHGATGREVAGFLVRRWQELER